ncbi:hypothetical protein [Aeromicrobium sp. UC242_57]|uniref:hypothetical protein n=1 Tax=Aeromicrobium sp. UC242_57 TaxID=3374624 RepID=UPI0037B7E255
MRVAAENSRQRWSLAGLHQAVDLLRDIADGRLDPDLRVDESRLRGGRGLPAPATSSIPAGAHGRWFAQALYDGRSRQGDLVVRTGEVDAPR